jgi:glycosyltransferase involved in cell wall biosynthesis
VPTHAISIAIPTYMRDEILLDTIGHLLALEERAAEILVVDQTPRHGEAVEVELQRLDEAGAIRWIRLSAPSIPHAMNLALAEARQEVVLFLDDDLIPSPALVKAHAERQADPMFDAVVGQILQPGEEPVAFPPHEIAPADPLDDLDFAFNSSEAGFIGNVMAGNLSVKRRRALEAGGFDENFTGAAFRFESDFAARLVRGGGRIWFEPQASIRHLKAGSGGLRSYGDHLRSASPHHSAGDYYFALQNLPRADVARYALRRLVRNVATRYHATHPWWIPSKLLGELRGLLLARRLRKEGRRLARSV